MLRGLPQIVNRPFVRNVIAVAGGTAASQAIARIPGTVYLIPRTEQDVLGVENRQTDAFWSRFSQQHGKPSEGGWRRDSHHVIQRGNKHHLSQAGSGAHLMLIEYRQVACDSDNQRVHRQVRDEQ